MTDPARVADPLAAIRHLPAGTAVIYRHFGAPDRARMARRLARACRSSRLKLLIAADPALARSVGADGVHWPERRLARARTRFGLTTASAHGAEGVALAARLGVDACILGPVFPTRSGSGNPNLGVFRASQIALSAPLPVIALGGVSARTAARLAGRGFAGIAAEEGLLEAEG
jgi:thiamine-phosphate pyrophosphorylase